MLDKQHRRNIKADRVKPPIQSKYGIESDLPLILPRNPNFRFQNEIRRTSRCSDGFGYGKILNGTHHSVIDWL